MLPYRMRQNLLTISVFLIAGSWAPGLALASTPAVHVKNKLFLSADVRIRGRVVDAKGNPMPGVTVQVQGTTTGTTTDAGGRFDLNAPDNGTLIISSIGYETQTIKLGTQNRRELIIHLLQSANVLNQLVVIGYGSQKQADVTGSISTISGAKLNEVPSSNITDALQGRLPGVQISENSSVPGAAMQIRIRGARSLTASNDPLIVLDGIPFPGNIADIDPSTIQSIDVLKDASATAIYGSRGANGVILITTIKGKEGMKPRITFNSYYGFEKAVPIPMMNSRQFTTLKEVANQFTSLGSDEDTSGKVNTNWQNLLYRIGLVTNNSLSVSGGTNGGDYEFGGSYYHDQGVIPLQYYTRYSMHGSVNQNIGNYIKIGFTTSNNYSITNGASLNPGTALTTTPITNPYNADGTLKTVVNMALDQEWVYTKKSLEALGNNFADRTNEYSTYNSVYGVLKIPWIKGLSYRANVGVNYTESNHGAFTGYGVFSSSPTSISSANISNAHTINWSIENLLIYDRTFGQKSHINFTALNSSEQTTYWYSSINATGIQNNAFQFYNMGAVTDPNGLITVNPNNQSYWQRGLTSWMGRLLYSYDDEYMITGTVRSDASSVLAPGHKRHTYAAASAGWNITKENFMKNVSVINNLKLRVGFGQTSNQAINPYQTLGLLSTAPYNFGPTDFVTGYDVTQLPNPQLGWEYTKTWNFGLDFALFNNRLTGTAEYYIEKTDAVLLGVNLPPTSGVGSILQNIGNTQNKGIELSLEGVILDNQNGFSWDAGFNIYANRNLLTSLASGEKQDLSNDWFVGYPIDVIYDYKKIGLWQTNSKGYQYLQDYEKGGTAGMVRVKYTGTYNADGSPTRTIGPADEMPQSVQPIFQGGFNTRLDYKQFDLTLVGQFQDGGTLISTLYGATGYLNMESGRRNNIQIDYWTPTNTNALFPNPAGPVNSNNPKYGTTLAYFNGSYLEVNTITLGYNFKGNWMGSAGIQSLRLYVTAQNPDLIAFSPYHKMSGMDPTTNSYGNNNAYQAVIGVPPVYQSRMLVVGYNTPETRNYIVGLNLIF
ncbi:MAG: SusC/RagA family TonB-linked outer membrane protein [Chitinophagaceae bacterium]|nr:MAG: SusC/RagA family TonB-linked outer membrane protein [Chitinophagaceae bacterium]